MTLSQARRFIVASIVVITLSASIVPVQIASGQASRADTDAADFAASKLIHELFSQVFESGNVAAADRLVADGAIIHTQRGDFSGPDGLLEYLVGIHRLYPDASFDLTSIDINGDAIVVGWTMTATHMQLDPIHGPQDAQVTNSGETTIIVSDGQVAALNQAEQGTTAV